MVVQAYPFKSMLFHGKSITGCFVFIPPWMEIMLEDLDLSNMDHWKYLSWGRLILPFECAMSPRVDVEGVNRAYAYIEEYWPYEPRSNDVLCR